MTEYDGLILDVTATDETPDKEFLERLGHPVPVCHGPDWDRASDHQGTLPEGGIGPRSNLPTRP